MSRTEDPGKWILDSAEIDRITDVPINDCASVVERNHQVDSIAFDLGTSTSSSFSRRRNVAVQPVPVPRMGRMQSSAARGLNGLRFMDGAICREGDGWKPIEKRFNQNAVDGRLPKDKFGAVIGMGDSKEFAGELFDTLARRRNINAANGITVDEMRKFWEDMTSQDIDARLQIFFDMCDKNGDGKLSEDEVRKIWQLETLLRGMVGTSEGSTKLKRTHSLTKTMIPMSYRHPVMKTMSTTAEFIHENWKRIWMVALWVVINVLLFTYKFVQYRHKAALQVMGYWEDSHKAQINMAGEAGSI